MVFYVLQYLVGTRSCIIGEIFSFTILGKRRVVISSVALMNEVCNEQRFSKMVSAGLNEVRNGTHDGLFTAHRGEHNWEVAHRVLVPAFGPLNIRAMFDDMKDIASQLTLKWARHGSDFTIPVTDDFTRLTLDTLALCSMDYRFNSFYQEQMHPFVDAMVNFLSECGERPRRPTILSAFYRNQEYQYWKDIGDFDSRFELASRAKSRQSSCVKSVLTSSRTGKLTQRTRKIF